MGSSQSDNNAGWTESPYLHHAMSDTNGNSGSNAPYQMEKLLTAAFGDKPEGNAEAALEVVRSALHYYRRVFDVEPELTRAVGRDKLAIQAQSAPNARKKSAKKVSGETPCDKPKRPKKPKAVIAIIDETLPFDLAMSGRVSGFWLQQGDMDDDDQGDLPFGREFAQNKVRLNRRARGEGSIAVAEGHYKRQPRKALRSLKRVTHGAAVLGEGVLRSKSQHSLVLVDLPAPAVRDTSGRLVPFFIIAGLVYILAKTRRLAEQHEIAAPGLPVVINLSFGVLAGPKDGSSPIEQVFDALSVENLGLPGVGPVHIVVPMGNGRLEQCIAKLEEGKPRDLGFLLQPDDKTPTYIEIRTQGDVPLKAKIARPGSKSWILLPKCDAGHFVDIDGFPGFRIYKNLERISDSEVRSMWLLAFPPTVVSSRSTDFVPPGVWHLHFSDEMATLELAVQRDDSIFGLSSGGRQAHFVDPSYRYNDDSGRLIEFDTDSRSPIRRTGTVNAFATASRVWRVGGGYLMAQQSRVDNDGEQEGPEATVPYSGLAQDREDGRSQSGDIVAPCEYSRGRAGLLMDSMAGGCRLRLSGTSLAAPLVARHLADLLAKGITDRSELALGVAKKIRNPDKPLVELRPW